MKNKPKVHCYNCENLGHFKLKCKSKQKQPNEIAMTITEAMLTRQADCSWWIGSAATRHIYNLCESFMEFKSNKA